eukprot:TRINITY_DN66162_c0_g1_i1.p2 TRINITY_DN66162_c0_g1~~TRINITY_DN66162_c0_g1_i1.p2  ORF type:complete len:160 (-),score=33.06 TRINITY_DN66162_c0_g1_i1:369-848(-)
MVFFFFQAEDGIRDVERSRGLGDVYKRQVHGLLHAANQVRRILDLPQNWLNNGPAAQFQIGLPDGFAERLHKVIVGEKLEMYYIDRRDQIFFKTYASADRGGYHVTDLLALNPAEDELVDAARWCMTQDVSLEFHQIIKDMFRKLGVKSVSDRIQTIIF